MNGWREGKKKISNGSGRNIPGDKNEDMIKITGESNPQASLAMMGGKCGVVTGEPSDWKALPESWFSIAYY